MSSLMKPVENCQPSSALSTARSGGCGRPGRRAAGSAACRGRSFNRGAGVRAAVCRQASGLLGWRRPPFSPPTCSSTRGRARTGRCRAVVRVAPPTCVPHSEVGVLGCQRVQLITKQDVVGRDVGVQQGQLGAVLGVLEHRLDELQRRRGGGRRGGGGGGWRGGRGCKGCPQGDVAFSAIQLCARPAACLTLLRGFILQRTSLQARSKPRCLLLAGTPLAPGLPGTWG